MMYNMNSKLRVLLLGALTGIYLGLTACTTTVAHDGQPSDATRHSAPRALRGLMAAILVPRRLVHQPRPAGNPAGASDVIAT